MPECKHCGRGDQPLATTSAMEQRNQTTEDILAERRKTHGDFTDHAGITQSLKMVLRRDGLDEKWCWNLNSAQREALEMILHKIGRIMAGNPNVRDHWDDIAGYATLIARSFGVPVSKVMGEFKQ